MPFNYEDRFKSSLGWCKSKPSSARTWNVAVRYFDHCSKVDARLVFPLRAAAFFDHCVLRVNHLIFFVHALEIQEFSISGFVFCSLSTVGPSLLWLLDSLLCPPPIVLLSAQLLTFSCGFQGTVFPIVHLFASCPSPLFWSFDFILYSPPTFCFFFTNFEKNQIDCSPFFFRAHFSVLLHPRLPPPSKPVNKRFFLL